MKSLKRPYAALAALVGIFALALQFNLMLGYAAANGQTPLWGVHRFFSFFTVLTNAIAAIVFAVTAFNAKNFLTRPSAQTAVAVYIVIVCVIYTQLLRNLWDPSGAQRLADYLLHYAMPGIYVVYWGLFVPKGVLRYRDAFPWLIYPAVYVACMLWRGAVIGQYPYPFLDADKLGYASVALNIAGLGAVFFALGLFAIWLGRRLARKAK
jgi:hypothetical protein